MSLLTELERRKTCSMLLRFCIVAARDVIQFAET